MVVERAIEHRLPEVPPQLGPGERHAPGEAADGAQLAANLHQRSGTGVCGRLEGPAHCAHAAEKGVRCVKPLQDSPVVDKDFSPWPQCDEVQSARALIALVGLDRQHPAFLSQPPG